MRPLLITLMHLCNNWEHWVAPDRFGRMQEFVHLTDSERAAYVETLLVPYLVGKEELDPPTLLFGSDTAD